VVGAFFNSVRNFQIFSLVGTSAAVLGSLLAGLAYKGKEGEPYSPLNHFISELGETGVSKWAWIFNLGLIISGICLIGGSISLGFLIPGLLAKLGMIIGVVCSLALSLVGVFPMNKIKPHGFAAMTYFRAGLMMMILFTLAILLKPAGELVIPRMIGLAGLLPILSFGVFLILIAKVRDQPDHPPSLEEMERPKIWPLAIAEWSIFLTSLFWFLVIMKGL
jgi:hypothetical membrane protein